MVKIIIDSTSDFSTCEAKALGLLRADLTLHWNGVEYRDGIDIEPPEFFARLAECDELPTTSQVPVPVFEYLFHSVTDAGDEAVAILLSHNLSGTFQSATIARDSLSSSGSKRIHLVDSGSGSLGSMLLIREAVRLRDSGSSAAEIAAIISEMSTRLHILAAVDTLKYLHKGGRLSTGAAVFGTLLSVKPVLEIHDGIITVAQKVRGNLAAYGWIAETLAALPLDNSLPPIIGSAQCPAAVEQFSAALLKKTGYDCKRFCDIGTVIGTHSGPGAIAIAYLLAP
ncbi:MAG: DegV family protein [Angelakisella sp.]